VEIMAAKPITAQATCEETLAILPAIRRHRSHLHAIGDTGKPLDTVNQQWNVDRPIQEHRIRMPIGPTLDELFQSPNMD